MIMKPQIVNLNITPEKLELVYAQRVGAILNQNETDRKNSDENWRVDQDIKLVGRIPRLVYNTWKDLGILDDEKALDLMLEKYPEYKTTEKRLI